MESTRWKVTAGGGRDGDVALSLSGAPGQVSVMHGEHDGGIEATLTTSEAFVLGLELVRVAGRVARIANVQPIEIE